MHTYVCPLYPHAEMSSNRAIIAASKQSRRNGFSKNKIKVKIGYQALKRRWQRRDNKTSGATAMSYRERPERTNMTKSPGNCSFRLYEIECANPYKKIFKKYWKCEKELRGKKNVISRWDVNLSRSKGALRPQISYKLQKKFYVLSSEFQVGFKDQRR